MAASSADKSIWLWDITDLRRPTTSARLTASTGSVHTVAFSFDGRWFGRHPGGHRSPFAPVVSSEYCPDDAAAALTDAATASKMLLRFG